MQGASATIRIYSVRLILIHFGLAISITVRLLISFISILYDIDLDRRQTAPSKRKLTTRYSGIILNIFSDHFTLAG